MAEVKDRGRSFEGPPARAKLFQHGGSQAVRLPKAFRFEGGEVLIRREGDRVILAPLETDWDAFWAAIDARKLHGEDWELPPDPPADPAKDLDW